MCVCVCVCARLTFFCGPCRGWEGGGGGGADDKVAWQVNKGALPSPPRLSPVRLARCHRGPLIHDQSFPRLYFIHLIRLVWRQRALCAWQRAAQGDLATSPSPSRRLATAPLGPSARHELFSRNGMGLTESRIIRLDVARRGAAEPKAGPFRARWPAKAVGGNTVRAVGFFFFLCGMEWRGRGGA